MPVRTTVGVSGLTAPGWTEQRTGVGNDTASPSTPTGMLDASASTITSGPVCTTSPVDRLPEAGRPPAARC